MWRRSPVKHIPNTSRERQAAVDRVDREFGEPSPFSPSQDTAYHSPGTPWPKELQKELVRLSPSSFWQQFTKDLEKLGWTGFSILLRKKLDRFEKHYRDFLDFQNGRVEKDKFSFIKGFWNDSLLSIFTVTKNFAQQVKINWQEFSLRLISLVLLFKIILIVNRIAWNRTTFFNWLQMSVIFAFLQHAKKS